VVYVTSGAKRTNPRNSFVPKQGNIVGLLSERKEKQVHLSMAMKAGVHVIAPFFAIYDGAGS
jgi:hypothetical protein